MKKYLIQIAESISAILQQLSSSKVNKIINRIFANRTLMLIGSNSSISFTFKKSHQIFIILALFAVIKFSGNFFRHSLEYSYLITVKNSEIDELKAVNNYLKKEFNNLNAKLVKIDEYIEIVSNNNDSENSSGIKNNKTKISDILQKITLQDSNSLKELSKINKLVDNIENKLNSRSQNIEEAIKIAGLNLKNLPNDNKDKVKKNKYTEISLNNPNDLMKKQGGPLITENGSFRDLDQAKIAQFLDAEKQDFNNKIEKLILLEKLASSMPFDKPMKNYFISSGFGSRFDPITGDVATHQGLDFVGPKNENVYNVADGKVIFAGTLSDYGNVVEIDHGFGITTKYAHLSKIITTQGSKVKKGQLIAHQGSTGRSTGDHLHYEIRYKNIPLNPRKFLEAGEATKI